MYIYKEKFSTNIMRLREKENTKIIIIIIKIYRLQIMEIKFTSFVIKTI